MTIQVSKPSPEAISKAAERQAYLQALLAHSSKPTGNTPSWLQRVRDRAQALIQEQALPSTRDEDWRFTDLSSLYQIPFQAPSQAQVEASTLASLRLGDHPLQCVFVNGRFAPQLSTPSDLPAGMRWTTLSDLEPSLQSELAQHQGANEVFTALNTCNFTDIAAFTIDKNQQVEQPIHLVFVTVQDGDTPIATYPRVLIKAKMGSRVTVLEEYLTVGQTPTLTDAVTEISVGANAAVQHIRVQREQGTSFHIGKTAVAQARDSRYTGLALNLGGRICRHHPEVVLMGEQTETKLDGLTLAVDQQVGDTHSAIAFLHPYCTAQQLHKCIVDDRARAVFNGKIFVPKAAQRTDASQMSRNLLLSPKARVDTKPQLEIVADDVKCAHGATVSQLDDDEVFYLQSRGLDRTAACDLLVEAFAAEMIHQVPLAALRQQLMDLVLSQVR